MNAPRRPGLPDAEIAQIIFATAREYAIVAMDQAGLVTAWSPGAEAIFGYSAAEMIGKPIHRVFLDADLAAGDADLELELARTSGRAEDSRWHRRKSGERFWGNGVTMALSHEGRSGFLKILRDETRSKLAEQQRVLLLNELNHRIKNTLATVQSITEQTLRAANVAAAIRDSLTNRLIALSEAHNLLVAESWAGADLATVVSQALAPHGYPSGGNFQVDGPSVRLSPQQAVSLSLVLHELATNAMKYGALSSDTGRVQVSWNLAQDGVGRRYLNLLWQETGGPPVAAPARAGFGTRMISRSFREQSGGDAAIEFRSEGLRCVVDLPLSSSEETDVLDVGGDSEGAGLSA